MNIKTYKAQPKNVLKICVYVQEHGSGRSNKKTLNFYCNCGFGIADSVLFNNYFVHVNKPEQQCIVVVPLLEEIAKVTS